MPRGFILLAALALLVYSAHGDSCVDCPEYMKLSASEKEAVIWNKIKSSKYKAYPHDWHGVTRYGTLAKMAYNGTISTTFDRFSDEYPVHRVKTIHTFGSVAKVKLVVPGDTGMTGLLRPGAASHGMIRFSLVKDPNAPCKGIPFTDGCVAPSLALKVFRDGGYHSGNIIAQYNLGDGQGVDFNIFRNQQKSWVPRPTGIAAQAVVKLFEYASLDAERLSNEDFATDYPPSENRKVVPSNIYFVPPAKVTAMFKKEKHEFRDDLASIPVGTTIFDLVIPGDDGCLCGKTNEPCTDVLKCKGHKIVAHVVTTSEFIASDYGDRRLFFQHERYAKKDRHLCKGNDSRDFSDTDDYRRAENHKLLCLTDDSGCPKNTEPVVKGCPYAAVWQSEKENSSETVV